jgi:hypothetical protein
MVVVPKFELIAAVVLSRAAEGGSEITDDHRVNDLRRCLVISEIDAADVLRLGAQLIVRRVNNLGLWTLGEKVRRMIHSGQREGRANRIARIDISGADDTFFVRHGRRRLAKNRHDLIRRERRPGL